LQKCNRAFFIGAQHQSKTVVLNCSRPALRIQSPLYAERQFKRAWFFPDEVQTNARSELTLQASKLSGR